MDEQSVGSGERFLGLPTQEREVKVTNANGEVTVTKVRIWNETVSNLTLMALGSSAPEILLSVIEVKANIYTHTYCIHTCISQAIYL